jgi:hypothetical protein
MMAVGAIQMATDFELISLFLEDVANSGASSSIEADRARELRQDIKVHLHSPGLDDPHPIHKHKTIGQAQEEALRRRTLDFLNATLIRDSILGISR